MTHWYRFLQHALERFPGFRALNRYICYQYTGHFERAKYPRGHYYSPLPDLAEVKSRAESLFRQDIDLGSSIALRPDAQYVLLTELASYYKDFSWPEESLSEYRFHLDQSYFCHGDAVILHAMLRHYRPTRVIEVGSGFSTALMLDTDERFLGSSIRFTCVEPFPERVLSALRGSDRERVQLVRDQVQNVSISTFQELEANDILFVDSSHVCKIGSDVNFIFFDVLPALKPGVMIHFHDVFWPFEYPMEWILDGRSWNEAYLLRGFLQYNQHFEILLFNSFAAHAFRSFIEEHMPQFMKNTGGSLWLRKVS